MDQCKTDIYTLQNSNPEVYLQKMQKKLVRDIVNEMVTPMQRNFNVDLKNMRKFLDEAINAIEVHKGIHVHHARQLDEIQNTLLRELRNNDSEKMVLGYELKRMQHLDRLKVIHAKDMFMNADKGTMLPSLDTAYASLNILDKGSTRNPSGPHSPVMRNSSPPGKDFATMGSETECVTQTELKGVCERYDKQPTHRQRIIITRSQEPHEISTSRSKNLLGGSVTRPKIHGLDKKSMDKMNETFHF